MMIIIIKRRKSRMSIYIETERLILRQFALNDVEELHSICSQPYILKWMSDWKRTIEERKEWISWIQKHYLKATKNAARIMLAVTLKSSKQLIGMVGIGNKEEVNNEIEIAYFISEEYSNNGYISEASKAMVEWAFTKLDTKMILNSGDTEERPFYYYRIYNKIN
jgi:[ribosomal protein S5]-alanine N-acetyltransferase